MDISSKFTMTTKLKMEEVQITRYLLPYQCTQTKSHNSNHVALAMNNHPT